VAWRTNAGRVGAGSILEGELHSGLAARRGAPYRASVALISQRKAEHLDLAARGDVSFREKTTLLEGVELVHEALPELEWSEIDLSTTVFGKPLRAPIVIAAMTGGTERAQVVNLELAEIAERRGYAIGLGSQRAMLKDRSLAATYQVRSSAPRALLLGNIGGVQAVKASNAELEDMVGAIGADALCVHLNPAMELVQAEGDRDFRGVLARLSELAQNMAFPIIAKETGCGFSRASGRRLQAAGIRNVDVSGAGGTSWVAVEAQRGTPQHGIGEQFWDWGVPTAGSLLQLAPLGFDTLIATGGLTSGLDVARALALGAHCGGIARPVLQAWDRGGQAEAERYLSDVEAQLRAALLLTGCTSVTAARAAPYRLSAELARWTEG
jgi:isopentenyl-diphosphate Delta-isomerase